MLLAASPPAAFIVPPEAPLARRAYLHALPSAGGGVAPPRTRRRLSARALLREALVESLRGRSWWPARWKRRRRKGMCARESCRPAWRDRGFWSWMGSTGWGSNFLVDRSGHEALRMLPRTAARLRFLGAQQHLPGRAQSRVGLQRQHVGGAFTHPVRQWRRVANHTKPVRGVARLIEQRLHANLPPAEARRRCSSTARAAKCCAKISGMINEYGDQAPQKDVWTHLAFSVVRDASPFVRQTQCSIWLNGRLIAFGSTSLPPPTPGVAVEALVFPLTIATLGACQGVPYVVSCAPLRPPWLRRQLQGPHCAVRLLGRARDQGRRRASAPSRAAAGADASAHVAREEEDLTVARPSAPLRCSACRSTCPRPCSAPPTSGSNPAPDRGCRTRRCRRRAWRCSRARRCLRRLCRSWASHGSMALRHV